MDTIQDRQKSRGATGSLRKLQKYSPMIRQLVKRDLKIKYRRSILGYLWSLLNPLLMMSVMTLVFAYMFRFDIPNYAIYLICGQTLWAFFSESTTMAMTSILGSASLIQKVYVPKFIFPLSRVVSSFVTMTFSLGAVVLVMLATQTPLHPTVLLFWLPLIFLFLFSCGVGMILSALAVRFRDIQYLYGVATLIWMYLTPIFYPLSLLPPFAQTVVRLNPMHHYIHLFRSLVLYGEIPGLHAWLTCLLSAGLALCLGLWVFKKMQKDFILYL